MAIFCQKHGGPCLIPGAYLFRSNNARIMREEDIRSF